MQPGDYYFLVDLTPELTSEITLWIANEENVASPKIKANA